MSARPIRNLNTGVALARGACPTLSAPMETGDGLLVRIVPSGSMVIDDFAALCAAARTHGNGLMEITARGSLQIRGLTEISAPLFANMVENLEIPFDDNVPVLISPLPAHPNAQVQPRDLAAEIRSAIAALGLDLAPKVSVVIDDGDPISLDELAADIRLRAVDGKAVEKFLVSVGGDHETATRLGVTPIEHAASLIVDLLTTLAESGAQVRARDVVAREGLDRFLRAAGSRIATAPKHPAVRTTETIGLHRLHDGACAIGVALPFGQAHALNLIALTRIAGANGAVWAALAPQRTLLLGPIDEMTAFALGTAADTLGFIVDARDARRRIAACAGAPACASGFIPSRELAAQIAERLPQGSFALHVSGCSKGCAHPRPAPLTILGTAQGTRIIEDDSVLHLPGGTPYTDDTVAETVCRIVAENENA